VLNGGRERAGEGAREKDRVADIWGHRWIDNKWNHNHVRNVSLKNLDLKRFYKNLDSNQMVQYSLLSLFPSHTKSVIRF